MDTITIIISIIGFILSIAALFAGVGYFRQGKNQAKLDANALLKDDVVALTKKVNEMDKEIKSLRLAIEEKDKKLSDTLAILQGRDPQMTAFVEIVKSYITANVPLLEEIKTTTIPTIKKLDKFLDKQHF